MPKSDKDLSLLTKALGDLKEFLPHLVLVGGWVPLLYSRILWHERHDPLLTVDIDFGIRNLAYHGKETIAQRVLQKKWGEHHMRIGHDTPFVPVVSVGTHLKADVEFIADAEFSSKIQNDLLGKEIYINRIQYFEVLLKKTIPISVASLSIHVPDPAHFIFHKLLTFPQREDPAKIGKDLYYAYFLLLTGPAHQNLFEEVRSLILNHPFGSFVIENIARYFEDLHSKGPALINHMAMTTPIATMIEDIQEDSFSRISGLVTNKKL